MPATYEPIASTTLGSATNNIEFASISSAYTDLRLVFQFRSTTGACLASLRFNNDSGTNYSVTYLNADGSSVTSSRATNDDNIGSQVANLSTNNWGFITYDIFSYAGSTYKTVLYGKNYDQNGSGNVTREVGLWRNTAAITTIDLVSGANQFAAGSTATLFGIKAA